MIPSFQSTLRLVSFFAWILFIPHLSSAQSSLEILKQLPDSLVLKLSNEALDSLFQFGNYTIPGGDSLDAEEVELQKVELGHVSLVRSYTTGQNGFTHVEIRAFPMDQGGHLVLIAQSGGVLRMYERHGIYAFELQNGKLQPHSSQSVSEATKGAGMWEFMKDPKNTSLALKLKDRMNTSYNLSPDAGIGFAYCVSPGLYSDEEHLSSFEVVYLWDGRTFTRLQPTQTDSK